MVNNILLVVQLRVIFLLEWVDIISPMMIESFNLEVFGACIILLEPVDSWLKPPELFLMFKGKIKFRDKFMFQL